MLKEQKIQLFQICIIFENVEYLEINIDLSTGYAEFKWHLKQWCYGNRGACIGGQTASTQWPPFLISCHTHPWQ